MASTIAAGTSAGTALAMAGDTSGALQLQTNGTTTAVTLDTSQNATFAGKVTSAGALTLASNGTTTAVTIDTSQNVGIGTSSPNKSSSSTALTVNTGTAANYSAIELASGNTLNYHINANDSAIYHVAAGTRPWIVYTNGTERMRIDSSGNLLFNSGYGSAATAYGCRAWVNFNGTGTVAIRASGNVSSITDNGTGDYTVNFTTAMSDANYVANISASVQFGGGYSVGASYTLANTASTNTTPTTSAFRFSVANTTSSVYDPVYVVASVFR